MDATPTLHVLSHGLHYASAVFEGERAYGGEIFKCTEHSERLKRSAQMLDFEIPYSVAEIDAAKRLVLEKNGLKDAYVRPVAWRGSEMMGVSAQNNKIHLAIAVWEWPSYFDPAQRLKGIRLDLAEYRRPDPTTAPCAGQGRRPLHDLHHLQARAERKGYADAMMLDWQGRVAECTGANIFFIKDGKIHTPIADCFLDGITRRTVIDLAKRRGIEVIERRIMPDELAGFSECFITGTAAEVTPVSEIAQLELQAGRDHQAADGRLHRRGAAEGQGRGGVGSQLSLSRCPLLCPLPLWERATPKCQQTPWGEGFGATHSGSSIVSQRPLTHSSSLNYWVALSHRGRGHETRAPRSPVYPTIAIALICRP